MNTGNIIEIDMSTDKREILISAFYQYDRGLKVRLINVPEIRDYSIRIEMCNSGDTVIDHYVTYSGEDVEIPEELLLDGRNVQIFLFAKGEDWGKTFLEVDVRICRRPST